MTTPSDGQPAARQRPFSAIAAILSTAAIIIGVAAISLNRTNVELGYYVYEPLGYVSSRSPGFSLISPTGAVIGSLLLIVFGVGVLGFVLGSRSARRSS